MQRRASDGSWRTARAKQCASGFSELLADSLRASAAGKWPGLRGVIIWGDTARAGACVALGTRAAKLQLTIVSGATPSACA